MGLDQIKNDLAAAHRIVAMRRLDDLTYTHMSARVPGSESFFIAPFGLMFAEVHPENLLEVGFDGVIRSRHPDHYNQTGYAIHSSIYKNRPELTAVIHLHTPASIAVSVMRCGLLPLTQHALHMYNRVSYHSYDSLTLHQDTQGEAMAESLGPTNQVMLLENHGLITCGRTLQEAMFFLHHLEQACRIQVQAMPVGLDQLILPSSDVCEKTRDELLSFETHLGMRDWRASLRQLERG